MKGSSKLGTVMFGRLLSLLLCSMDPRNQLETPRLTKWCSLGDLLFDLCQIVHVPRERTERLQYTQLLGGLLEVETALPRWIIGYKKCQEAEHLNTLRPAHYGCWTHVEGWHHRLVLSVSGLIVTVAILYLSWKDS